MSINIKTGKNVGDVVITPDNDKMITGSDDGMIIIWDIDNGNILKKWRAYNNSDKVTKLVLTSKGDKIISGSINGLIKIWNINGKLLKTLKGHESSIRELIIPPKHDKLLFSISLLNIEQRNRFIWKIWEIKSGKLIKTKEISQAQALLLSLNVSSRNTMNNVTKVLTKHRYSDRGTIFVNITPNNDKIVLLIKNVDDMLIKIRDTTNGNLIKTLKVPKISNLIVTNDTIIIGSKIGSFIKILDINSGKLLKTLKDVANIPMQISPNGDKLVSASIDELKIWNLNPFPRDIIPYIYNIPIASDIVLNKEIFDPIMYENIVAQDFLDDDDNVVFYLIDEESNIKRGFGYPGSELQKMLDNKEFFYECLKPINAVPRLTDVKTENPFVKIAEAIVYYVPANQLAGILKSRDRIIALWPAKDLDQSASIASIQVKKYGTNYRNDYINIVSADHCQKGTDKKIHNMTPVKLIPSDMSLGGGKKKEKRELNENKITEKNFHDILDEIMK